MRYNYGFPCALTSDSCVLGTATMLKYYFCISLTSELTEFLQNTLQKVLQELMLFDYNNMKLMLFQCVCNCFCYTSMSPLYFSSTWKINFHHSSADIPTWASHFQLSLTLSLWQTIEIGCLTILQVHVVCL